MATVTCKFCHLSYDNSITKDKRTHTKRHNKFKEAQLDLIYIPDSYNNREHIKKESRDILNSNAPFYEKHEAARSIVKTYYDASLEGAIINGYHRIHPNIDKYFAMIDLPDLIPNSSIIKFRKIVGRIEDEIPSGYTNWYPPNSKSRKNQLKHS